jgi:hypothetical protein
MNIVGNVVFVICAVIAALYLAPFLIALIASGLLQLVFALAFVYCLIKLARNSKSRDFDDYR